MFRLKYFQSFFESENNEEKLSKLVYDLQNPESSKDNYNEEEKCYNFDYYGEDEERYSIKIYPLLQVVYVQYPDDGFVWCALSAVESNSFYFKSYTESIEFYNWLLATVSQYRQKGLPAITYHTHIEDLEDKG